MSNVSFDTFHDLEIKKPRKRYEKTKEIINSYSNDGVHATSQMTPGVRTYYNHLSEITVGLKTSQSVVLQ